MFAHTDYFSKEGGELNLEPCVSSRPLCHREVGFSTRGQPFHPPLPAPVHLAEVTGLSQEVTVRGQAYPIRVQSQALSQGWRTRGLP